MTLIFRTKPDAPHDVEIAGVGVLGAGGKGGIPVDRAAIRMHELQDDNHEPLTGRALRTAAERFAKERGLATESQDNVDEQKLAVEAGAFPEAPSIEEIGRRAAERDEAWHIAPEAEASEHSSLPEGTVTEFVPPHQDDSTTKGDR